VTDPKDSPDQNQPPRSAFAGCLILITMAVVVMILIASAAWALKKQSTSLASFTDLDPLPTPIASAVDHQAGFNSLVSRLEAFKHEVENGRAIELALTPTDLNLAISQYDSLKSFRGMLSADSISESTLSGRIHLPLNSTEKLPSVVCSILKIEQRPNNLNGTYNAKPTLTDGKLILTLKSLTPTQGEIPDPFLQGISRILVSGDLEEDAPLQALLSKLTSAELRDGKFVLGFNPAAEAPSAKEEADEMANKAKQFAALGAVILILTMILLFIVISRWRKSRRTQ
jgi:hypothetical protein